MLEYQHQHWCAYVAHGGLQEDSFANVKKSASEILADLQNSVFPWLETVKKDAETEEKDSKIDSETQELINKYKVWRSSQATNDAQK